MELRSCPIFLLFSSCLLQDLSSWKGHLTPNIITIIPPLQHNVSFYFNSENILWPRRENIERCINNAGQWAVRSLSSRNWMEKLGAKWSRDADMLRASQHHLGNKQSISRWFEVPNFLLLAKQNNTFI